MCPGSQRANRAMVRPRASAASWAEEGMSHCSVLCGLALSTGCSYPEEGYEGSDESRGKMFEEQLTYGPRLPRMLEVVLPGTAHWTLVTSASKRLCMEGWGEKGCVCSLILSWEMKAVVM